MAHKAKDRVTNQEFPSCHSWERKRGQKLRIKRFSSEGEKRKAANSPSSFVKILINLHVSRRVEDIMLEKKLLLFHYESGPIIFAWWPLSDTLME